jgi:hypothetical protein
MFGRKKYDYKLELTEEVAGVIFKERNINVSLRLITQGN